MYLGFYDQLQFSERERERERERDICFNQNLCVSGVLRSVAVLRERERERENLRVHFWILKSLDAMHDRSQKQKTFLIDVLLNEVILILLSKYNGPTGSIFIAVPLLNFQNFEFL